MCHSLLLHSLRPAQCSSPALGRDNTVGVTGPGDPEKPWNFRSLGSLGILLLQYQPETEEESPMKRSFRGDTGPTQTPKGFF